MSESSPQSAFLIDGMRTAIVAFKENELSFNRLVRELKSRISALWDVADDEWVSELKSIWNQLEVVNAFFIESGRSQLSLEEHTEAEDILEELQAALTEY